VAVKPPPEAVPQPEAFDEPPEPLLDNEPLAAAPNPFADSVPFETAPVETDYDKAEEVSLEQLLAEGRERPMTISGDVAVPHIEEVEELGAAELVDSPSAVAVLDAPEPQSAARSADSRVRELEQQVASLQSSLRVVLRELDDLRARVSAALQ
jgi:hypothetical protein